MSDQVARLAAELADVRRQLDARQRVAEVAERRLAEARSDARALAQTNESLNMTLREARDSLLALRQELEALGRPPASFGVLIAPPDGASPEALDVSVGGRVMRAAVAPEVAEGLAVGDSVLLNEALTVVARVTRPDSGELVRLREELDDGRLVVATPGDDELVLTRGRHLVGAELTIGESLLADRRAFVALARVPRSDLSELRLDDEPDATWDDIGGLATQIEQIRDAVELPFAHRDLFARFGLAAPKGVLLFGPPGCGKTMIAKAVASSSGSSFLNIKGPELLDKYVGETERQIRTIFTRARELATNGRPVVVFFDEMDSLFRTRGSGVSSDVESTVVPQLLAELDGVEALQNVIVIGATNREDLIDPAILRPGRLDVKIKLERPDAAGAAEILSRYVRPDLPLNAAEVAAAGGEQALVDAMIDAAVVALFDRSEANRFVEVTYASGEREVLYVGDFVSGAMLANIVARAKKSAIKEILAGGDDGLRRAHMVSACADEVAENEELANTTNPDDWARVSGRRGERIVFLRTLHGARSLSVDQP